MLPYWCPAERGQRCFSLPACILISTDVNPLRKLDASLIPKGWSTDSADLEDIEEEFPKSLYDIKSSLPVKPIIIDIGASPTCLVECPEGTYDLYNLLSEFVWKVLAPSKLEEIVPKLTSPSRKGLKLKWLESMEYGVEEHTIEKAT